MRRMMVGLVPAATLPAPAQAPQGEWDRCAGTGAVEGPKRLGVAP